MERFDGRWALYRVFLDGTDKIGAGIFPPRRRRDGMYAGGTQGACDRRHFTTDVSRIEYFDPVYKAIAVSLAKALPNLPLISFESASADEQRAA